MLLKTTSSLCPACLAQVPAEVLQRGSQVFLRKTCASHGVFEALIASDAKHYHLSLGRGEGEAQVPASASSCCTSGACCGPAPARQAPAGGVLAHDPTTVEHSSTCIALIEIVTSCNLECPTCFAGSEKKETVECLSFDEIVARVGSVLSRKKNIDILQLSGGEPTLHPEFFRVLEWALAHPRIGYCLLNTNGVRLAQDPAFGAELGDLRRRLKKFEVYLQFDGPQEAGQERMRGLDLRRLRERALAVCAREEIPATLAMTIDDHNLAHLGDTLRLAVANPGIRGITFQPMFGSGRAYEGVNVTVKGKPTGKEGFQPSLLDAQKPTAAVLAEHPQPPTSSFASLDRLLDRHGWKYGTIRRTHTGHLPHWDITGATYAITFRLADSVDQDTLEKWRKERALLEAALSRQAHGPLPSELDRLEILHGQRIQHWLDQGHGECLMRDPRIADIVQNALLHFDGERYDLLTWCVMPNHVHAVVRPKDGHSLPDILHSWKSFSSNQINRVLEKNGPVWMRESFDRIIRDASHLANAVKYVMDNPKQARLGNWRWCGLAAWVEPYLTPSSPLPTMPERGRLEAFPPSGSPPIETVHRPPVERLTVADIVREVVAQSAGLLREEDFTPLPCGDPNCHTVGYLLRHGDQLIGLAEVINLPEMQGFLRNRVNFSLADLEQCGCESEELGHALRALEIGPHSVLRLFVKPFMDAWTYDQHRIDRCCVHVVGEGGKLESFCRHYATR